MKITKTDKAIVSLFVSLGIFTTLQAKEYVSQITKKEKKQFISVKDLKDKNIVLCEGVTDLVSADNKKGT